MRAYAAGDAARRIHWRQSSRRGELLVREADAERAAQVEIRLRTRCVDGSAHDASGALRAFERRVSWAASEVICQLEAGRAVGLRSETEFIPPASNPEQRTRVLDYLARVQPLPVLRAHEAADGRAA